MFKPGDKVRYLGEVVDDYHPLKDTIGKIITAVDMQQNCYWIQWPDGTTKGDGEWCCIAELLELVEE